MGKIVKRWFRVGDPDPCHEWAKQIAIFEEYENGVTDTVMINWYAMDDELIPKLEAWADSWGIVWRNLGLLGLFIHRYQDECILTVDQVRGALGLSGFTEKVEGEVA